MPAKRIPWIKFWPELLDHEKFSELTDSESWTWVNVWGKASQQPMRWRFASAQHAAKVSGRPLDQVRRLIEVRLLDERSDGVWVHDWQQWQHRYPSDYEDSGNAPSTLGEHRLNGSPIVSSTLPEDSANAPRTLPEDSANGALNDGSSASCTRARAKRGEGRREKGDIDDSSGLPGQRPKEQTARKSTPNSAVVDALRSAGFHSPVLPRDHAAIKAASGIPPEQIVELYGMIHRGEYGDAWLQRQLSVRTVIEAMPGYLAWKENGPPRPTPIGRNGQSKPPQTAPPPREYIDVSGLAPDFLHIRGRGSSA